MIDHLNDEQLNTLADSIRLGVQRDDEADLLHAHLEGCGQCRERLGRLARLLNVAEAMPRRVEPPADLWPSIRTTIEELRTGSGQPGRRRLHESTQPRWFARGQFRLSLAVAAAIVMAILFGTHVGDRFTTGWRATVKATANSSSTATPNAAHEIVPTSAVTALDTEDLHAEEELMAALELRRSALRPSTSAQIDSSLRVIDAAIAELEAARARDPNNAAIRQLLAASRARKLEVLKQAQNAS